MEQVCNATFLYFPSSTIVNATQFIQQHSIKVLANLADCLKEKPDAAIIANATPGHIPIAELLVEHQIPFLIEKPVSNSSYGLKKLCEQIKKKRLPVLVGFQLRHHPTYKLLVNQLRCGTIGKPLSLYGYVGQYLPDWRPDSDYRHTVSASKFLGGGVLTDLCHEIDIAMDLLGPVDSVFANLCRISDLEINTEDTANLTVVYKNNCHANIHLNYLDREYTWYTRIVGTKGTLLWDYAKGFLQLNLAGQNQPKIFVDPTGLTRDSIFEAQAKHWLDVIAGKEAPLVSFDQGCEVTKLILAARQSSTTSAVTHI